MQKYRLKIIFLSDIGPFFKSVITINFQFFKECNGIIKNGDLLQGTANIVKFCCISF